MWLNPDVLAVCTCSDGSTDSAATATTLNTAATSLIWGMRNTWIQYVALTTASQGVGTTREFLAAMLNL